MAKKKSKSTVSRKVTIPKGLRVGDRFSRGGRTYQVRVGVTPQGKRWRAAVPVQISKVTCAPKRGAKARSKRPSRDRLKAAAATIRNARAHGMKIPSC